MRSLIGRVPGVRSSYYLYRRMFGPRPVLSNAIEDSLPEGRFSDIVQSHKGNRLIKWDHYGPIYDAALSSILNRSKESGVPLRLLEIGVMEGGSLEVWRSYLGSDAVIFGVDKNPACVKAATIGQEVRIGSQADHAFLERVVEEMGGVDIVIDDGSHIAKHQRRAFDVLFPLMSSDGVYIIEDTHTSYFWTFGGGYRIPGTAISFAKDMTDGINKAHFRFPVSRRARRALEYVYSISFFDSVIVIQKGHRVQPKTSTWGLRRVDV